LGDPWRDAASALALDSVLRQLAGNLGKIASRRNLKGKPRQRIGWAGLECDRLQPLPAREKGALAIALDQGEADNGGIVGTLPIEIGRGQRGMAEPAHRDHRLPPERRHARARVAPHDAERAFLAWMLALMAMGNYASFAPSGKTGWKKVRASPALGLCAD